MSRRPPRYRRHDDGFMESWMLLLGLVATLIVGILFMQDHFR